MDKERENPRSIYLMLLLVQLVGAGLIVWKELPDFRQLALSPGHQLPFIPYSNFTTIGGLLRDAGRLLESSAVYSRPSSPLKSLLSHLFLFSGRLSFIFGGALFSVVFFRHLPELAGSVHVLALSIRGLLLGGALFALFCLSLELERLGHAFGDRQGELASPTSARGRFCCESRLRSRAPRRSCDWERPALSCRP
jgi:hypothetical protein